MEKQSVPQLYSKYKEIMQQIADVKYASAVLQWDQETYLPPNGAHFRSRQLATLAEVAHNMFVDDKLCNVLNDLHERDGLSQQEMQNVALTLEDYNKTKKFSAAFVRNRSEAISEAFFAWVNARKHNRFDEFEGPLNKIVDFKRQEADIIGFEDHPYNALMDEYEKGATVAQLDRVFKDVTPALSNLLAKVKNVSGFDDRFLHQHFAKDKQWEWGLYIAKQLNFDFASGRQDISAHPFSTNFNAQDVRITTRIDEENFENMTWSTIHEVGHALYEQGLPPEQYGLPLGEYTSLGIHESQSRLWENCVGRGEAFWTFYFSKLQSFFPDQFKNVGLNDFMKAINKVKPSLIRTEADELTYHFHVMIRYELEKQLINNELQVADIPAYWNEQYQKLLGVTVPNDANGCLQDVHWSHGSFGYFPTYSLGSFYAAQFWEQAKKELPDLEQTIATVGSTLPLLNWLRTKIHAHGRMYTSDQLCNSITNTSLDSKVFVNYLTDKYQKLYNF